MRKKIHLIRLFLFISVASTSFPHSTFGQEALLLETFEAVWSQVGKTYYDASYGGLDWDEVGGRYRELVGQASDLDEARALISSMLYELGDSHLALLSPSFVEGQPLPWTGGWAGVEACFSNGEIVLYRIDENGAAFEAGIRNGDILLEINGMEVGAFGESLGNVGMPEHIVKFSALTSVMSRFRAGVGDSVAAKIRSPDGNTRLVEFELAEYTGRKTQPFGNIGRNPLLLETLTLDNGVAYLRFNLWFPEIMSEIRDFVSSIPADAPGMVIDLRGNPGGVMFMAGGLAGMLCEEQVELGRTSLREGHMNIVGFPQRGSFHGQVALLVDETSVSTSELFAVGLQELGRVRVFGQPTPGAALPSVTFSLPSGDFLQIAMGDFKTPNGFVLEGQGVTPDEVVPISPIALSNGQDTVLSAALNWLQPN